MFSRRTLLKTTASGFGYLAFAALAHEQAARANPAANPLAPKAPHLPPRAKRVIFLCMEGGPSHVDTFDHKPRLTADDGKPYNRGRFAGAKLLGPLWKFNQHGQTCCSPGWRRRATLVLRWRGSYVEGHGEGDRGRLHPL